MYRIILFISTLCLFVSCRQIEVGNMQSFALKSFSGRSILADVKIEINNQRLTSVTLKKGEFALIVDDRTIGIATLQSEVSVKARSMDTYYFPVELKLADDISSYFSIIKILKKSNDKIIMKGWVEAKSGFVSKRFDFEKEIGKDQIPFL